MAEPLEKVREWIRKRDAKRGRSLTDRERLENLAGEMAKMEEYFFDPRNVLPNGLTLLQVNPDCAADLRQESSYFGWLFVRGPETDQQWVTIRKLNSAEIEEAYDQSADMMVKRGTNGRSGGA